jgi:hypothetical protein
MKLFLSYLLILVCGLVNAQQQSAPNSLNNNSSSSNITVKHTKSKKKVHFFSPKREKGYRKPNVKHTAQYEFYERVEKAAKEKQRILKELSKPQYSDFRYFGHKKMPKKRRPHKMRYCGECQIRH